VIIRNASNGLSVPEHMVATRNLRPLSRSTTRSRCEARETRSSNILGMEEIGGRADWSAACLEALDVVEVDTFRWMGVLRFLSVTTRSFAFFFGGGASISLSSRESMGSSFSGVGLSGLVVSGVG
jgi:hypothetical protein